MQGVFILGGLLLIAGIFCQVFACVLAARLLELDIRLRYLWLPMSLMTLLAFPEIEGLWILGVFLGATVLRYWAGLESWSQALPLVVLAALMLWPIGSVIVAVRVLWA
ncbi:hypothetical protein QSV34_02815 [Porticoccus sp. W117]|uniref:hypothetical protein n=1 Tax=Porticoccus sp. W117 TaxID=3054777 RepID=UPI00259A15C5|nr:hypothetical protein [Porticoccus sp. W117]MDM3870283.1 hypothetical protein [Porticoccus sp. W117]